MRQWITAALTISVLGAAHRAVPVDAIPQGSTARAEVLVLGVFHMANPGRDVFNTQVDDVLSATRQKEIAEVIEVLKRFRPTKIAIEGDFSEEIFGRNYSNYLAGKYQLTRNERDQLGFRLAKELGHTAIYPVDVSGEFPHLSLVNHAKANGREKEFNAVMDEIGRSSKEQSAYLASHSILETLLYTNADERVAEAVGFYFRQAQFGRPWDWAGADLVSAWFQRNMRIYSNIARLVESPADRVLAIYGSGHLGWLQYAFLNSPNLRLRKLGDLVQ